GIIVKKGKLAYSLVTGAPLAFLATVTTVAAWQKIFSEDASLGFFAAANELAVKLASGTLPADRIASAPTLIFNQRLDGWLTGVFTLVLWFVISSMLRVAYRRMTGRSVLAGCEAPYQPTQLNGNG